MPHTKVFFPKQAQAHPSGYLVGWSGRSSLCSIVTIAPSSIPLGLLDQALALLASDPQLQVLIKHCGRAPSVIGIWQHHGDDQSRMPSCSARAKNSELWLSLEGISVPLATVASEAVPRGRLSPALPILRQIYCHGVERCTPVQFIFFDAEPSCAARLQMSLNTADPPPTAHHPEPNRSGEASKQVGCVAAPLNSPPPLPHARPRCSSRFPLLTFTHSDSQCCTHQLETAQLLFRGGASTAARAPPALSRLG